MMKYSRLIIFSVSYLLLTVGLLSCEELYDIEMQQVTKEYVVDGKITDRAGPHRIKLTYTSAYTRYAGGLNFPVNGAQVSITDAKGITEILTEAEDGSYFTSETFSGFVANSYILHIVTADGDEILSYPETMPPPIVISDYYYEFIDDPVTDEQGHKVWIVVNDQKNYRNYYKWKWEGAYIFNTLLRGFPGSTTCWRYEYDKDFIRITEDRFFDGNTFKQEICYIPYFGGNTYLVTVYAESLSPGSYEFYRLVNEQINELGGIFDPPPARIRGNLYCVNDKTKNIHGYFSVSSLAKFPVLIYRGDLGTVKNIRDYPRNVNCWTLPNSEKFDYDPDTWPEGWE